MNNKIPYFNNLRVEMLGFVPRHCKKILEIGCGEGLFGAQLITRQGAEVWGVEPNQEAAKVASSLLFNVQNSVFDANVQLPEKYFDCIIINDVLEHMIDPWEALEIIKRYLKTKESLVVFSIPNFRFWENIIEIFIKKNFIYKEAGILDKTHFRFFTEKSIIQLFLDSGFEILQLNGINATGSRKFKLLNTLLFNTIRDMQFLQFAVVVKVK